MRATFDYEPEECPHTDTDWPMRRCRQCGATVYETTAGVIRHERKKVKKGYVDGNIRR